MPGSRKAEKYHNSRALAAHHGSRPRLRGYYARMMAGMAVDRTEDQTRLGLTPEEWRLARALGGDAQALEKLAAEDSGDLARRHRVSGTLYLRARRLGLQTPAVSAWRRQTLAVAAQHLQLQAMAREVADCLAEAGAEWLPLKGWDLATRLYEAPEERPTGDLDLLISPERLDDAVRALTAAGWCALYQGPRNRVFLAEEGYAWMAVKAQLPLLEIHFRLWGLVPERFGSALFERSRPDATLPTGGRRLSFADAYLVAAVHAWLSPRYLVAWWELARLAERLTPEQIEGVVSEACSWDLQLPVMLAAEVSATLWGEPGCQKIHRDLAGELRLTERLLATRARRRLTALSLASLQMARLLAGRRSRQRLKGPWRRVWPHPGIVERSTPEDWPWLARRLWFQARLPFQ